MPIATKSKPRAVAYIRVSSTRQAAEGESLEAQQDRIAAYCRLRGLDLVAQVDDPAQSTSKPLGRRNGGKQLLHMVASGQVEAVVVFRLDRAWRSVVDCLSTIEQWDKRGIAVHILDLGGATVDSRTAVGKLFLTMLAGMAEFERHINGERTAAALANKFAHGRLACGQAPYGWRYDGQDLVPVQDEQRVRGAVLALAAGGSKPHSICRVINSQGMRNREGGAWNSVSIYRMLQGCKRLPATEPTSL